MPKLEESSAEDRLLEPKQIEPVRVVLDPSSPSLRSIVRVVLVALALILVGSYFEAIVNSLTKVFFLIVLSLFFAYLIDPLVRAIRRPFKAYGKERFMPRAFAIVISYVAVFVVLSVAISYIAPRATDQAKEFATNVPSYVTTVRERLFDLNRRLDRLRLPNDIESRLNDRIAVGVDSLATFFTSVIVGTYLLNLLTYAPWLILVPILSFFFLKDFNSFRLGILHLFPAGRYRLRTESLLQDINSTLAAYVRAQLISCVLIGVICTIGFYLIGLKYTLLLGILAGIFEFIPLLGPAVVGLIVITSALVSDNPWSALPTLIFLITLRVIHDYFTYPRIVRGGIHLHPVLIILSVLAGEQIAGIPGVFLAIPVVALITVAYKHFLDHQGSKTLFEGLVHQEPRPEEEPI